MNSPRILKKARPAPITCTTYYDEDDDMRSSPSSLSPSTTEMTTDSDTHSEHSSSSHSTMPLTKARLERVLDVHAEVAAKKQKKRASTPASAPASGIFKLGWWRDSSDESESEDEYPPTPLAATPRRPESPPRPETARFRPVSPRPRTPVSARPETARFRPKTPVSARPITPRSARPTAIPTAMTPRSPLSAQPSMRPFILSPTCPEPASLSQLAVQLQQQDIPKPPKFRRRPTELNLERWSSESEELSTSPSSASSSSAPPSPPDSLPPSPSALTVPQYGQISTIIDQPDTPVPTDLLSPLSPSSRFCARNASMRIKDVEGYVSFGAIEGLGMPDMDDESHREEVVVSEELTDSKKSGSWTPRWLTPWKKP